MEGLAGTGGDGSAGRAMTDSSKTLVLGAGGFLGSHVALALAERGRPLRLFARPSSDTSATDALEAERVTGDVRDPETVGRALEGCDVVYHCVVDTRAHIRDTSVLRSTNVEGLRHVIEAALEQRVRRLVYTSTYVTLGVNASGVSSEADVFNWEERAPEYVRVRVEAEELFRDACRSGLPGVACNVGMTYGPGDLRPTGHGWMLREMAEGRVPVHWDAQLPAVGIGDAAEALLLAEERGRVGERYLVVERAVSVGELGRIAARATGRSERLLYLPPPVMWLACWLAETQARIRGRETYVTPAMLRLMRTYRDFDADKARSELGWKPRPVEQAIAEGARWFLARATQAAKAPDAP
jgi:dihydroflavonol-4-reductase